MDILRFEEIRQNLKQLAECINRFADDMSFVRDEKVEEDTDLLLQVSAMSMFEGMAKLMAGVLDAVNQEELKEGVKAGRVLLREIAKEKNIPFDEASILLFEEYMQKQSKK